MLEIWKEIEKLVKKEEIIIVNNAEVKNNLCKYYLQSAMYLQPTIEFTQTSFYEKPKSKYHK